MTKQLRISSSVQAVLSELQLQLEVQATVPPGAGRPGPGSDLEFSDLLEFRSHPWQVRGGRGGAGGGGVSAPDSRSVRLSRSRSVPPASGQLSVPRSPARPGLPPSGPPAGRPAAAPAGRAQSGTAGQRPGEPARPGQPVTTGRSQAAEAKAGTGDSITFFVLREGVGSDLRWGTRDRARLGSAGGLVS